VPYRNITTDVQLEAYCRELAQARSIAFDTEFVAEDTFRPVLCLVQVSAEGQEAVIDSLAVQDMRPFWEVLAAEGHQTIVHSGRGEVEFCVQAIGRPPADLLDVQIASGLVGIDYPAGYGTLISRLLGDAPKKHETRTDWRRRPLSSRQIEYALDDVRYLHPIRDILVDRLTRLERLGWLADEMQAFLAEIHKAMTQERWWRVSGNASLNPRALAIVRELWRWRQAEAERLDKPVRRVLRDDLIVELARRQSADPKQIQAVRGMEWGKLRQQLPEIAEAVRRGLESPEKEWPPSHREIPPQLSVLGQLFSAALGSICRQAQLAPSLVGTPSDVRDLIVYRVSPLPGDQPPILARGWRAEVVGHMFDDLLAGKLSLRVGDPHSEHPLVIEDCGGK
jgi:ribonuclease D